jgi:prolyl-tRNA synthetase
VLNNIAQIVREEMNNSGAMEVSMPIVQHAELWQESGRWDQMGPELLRFKDRHNRDFCLGPTHEEVITDLVRNEYASYKQLPATFYQIQTKFRDERRPRFGVMRAREFIMKDAYSFHDSEECLKETYEEMHRTYCRIFKRLDLNFRSVLADSGNIGGSTSHEFHVLANSGEDEIVFSSEDDYAANIDLAEGGLAIENQKEEEKAPEEVDTGNAATVKAVANILEIQTRKIVKTLIVHAEDGDGNAADELVALFLRGDQEVNVMKAQNIAGVYSPLKFASDDLIRSKINGHVGYLGPVKLPIRKVADYSVKDLYNFTCGANKPGKHLTNMNWSNDCSYDEIADIRRVQEKDISPTKNGSLSIKKGIEVGHIFQLGQKYSHALNATVLERNGKAVQMLMGCYGIGITRLVAACIEQNHDEKGIIWPENIAPFQLIIIEIDAHKSAQVTDCSNSIYEMYSELGVDILLDDRDRKTSPGVKFADSELIGIPHRLVISPRSLAKGVVEYTQRRGEQKQQINVNEIEIFLNDTLLA